MDLEEKFRPGFFEIYTGCMNSGKGKKLIIRADGLDYEKNPDTGKRGIPYIIIKPHKDTRSKTLYSRFYPKEKDALYVPDDRPSETFELVRKYRPKVILFDELNFFEDAVDGTEIESVVLELINSGHHVIGAGLNQNFRGEPYGRMPYLLSFAHVHSLYATCDYPSCENLATRTQRLVDGWPALYDEPTDSIEGAKTNESYQARCVFHHAVPRTLEELGEYKANHKQVLLN